MKKRSITRITSSALITALLGLGSMTPVLAGSLSVSEGDTHTYDVYQIFTGDYDKDSNTLSNAKWGVNTENNGADVSEDILNSFAGLTDAELLAKLEGYLAEGTTAMDTVSSEKAITDLADGYYLIKDTTNVEGEDDSVNLYVVKVVDDVEVTVKRDKPSFDKEVLDEVGDAEEGSTDGWGETADHAINESFQFRLTASIPNTDAMDAYKTYKLQFNDIMSEHITFESLDSVNLILADGTVVNVAADQYGLDGVQAGDAGASWTLTIEDVIPLLPEGASIRGLSVEVVYSAHLNEKAVINNQDDNRNKGSLTYSNNPNVGGEGDTGETPDDTVYVFTYDFDNLKTDETGEAPLKDAEFRLYADKEMTKEIALIYDENLEAYRPIKAEGEAGTVMTTPADGNFKIHGVDAGTYYLKETKAPAGYNLKNEPIEIVISATHKENDNEISAETIISRTFDGKDGTVNTVINKKGSNLPETGGIGTPIVYATGGLLVFGAGSILLSKKKKVEEE